MTTLTREPENLQVPQPDTSECLCSLTPKSKPQKGTRVCGCGTWRLSGSPVRMAMA